MTKTPIADHARALMASGQPNDVLHPDCPLCVVLVESGWGAFGGKPTRPTCAPSEPPTGTQEPAPPAAQEETSQ